VLRATPLPLIKCKGYEEYNLLQLLPGYHAGRAAGFL
jgi:hypothetical protein